MLDADTLEKLAKLRIVFLIDEIHRSNSGDQHDQMVNIFDELQTPFDAQRQYNQTRTKKNLIVGFTATPDDHTLARFGQRLCRKRKALDSLRLLHDERSNC